MRKWWAYTTTALNVDASLRRTSRIKCCHRSRSSTIQVREAFFFRPSFRPFAGVKTLQCGFATRPDRRNSGRSSPRASAGMARATDNAHARPRDLCLTNCAKLSLQKNDGFRRIAIHSFHRLPPCRDGFVQEKRRTQRTRIMKAAQLVFDHGNTVVHCTVRDVSANGACLQLASTIALPESFELSFDSFRSARWCHVTWRAEPRLFGVTFGAKAKQ